MAFQRVQRELSAEEIARLRELRAGGMQLKELAHQFGISHQTVSRYARGIVPPPARQTRPELPRWSLGAGQVHRRDIYDGGER